MKTAVVYSCHLIGRTSEPNNEMQIALCKEYAEKHGIEIVGNYTDCIATKQQSLLMKERLLKDCKHSHWDMVLFPSITILGRNFNKIMAFISKLRKYSECKFIDQENNETLKQLGYVLDLLHKEALK